MVKLSYVVPVYNVEAYVRSCLKSLYAQGLSEDEFEVVCVNDGSTDTSLQILEDFQRDHGNMTIKTIPNGGLSNARNTGVGIARGEYIFFIDSDDYIAENTVKPLLELAMEKQTDMLYFDFIRADADNLKQARYYELGDHPEVLPGKEYYAKYYPNNGAWLFLIRRAFMVDKQVYFEVGRFAEDGMFSVLSTSKADKVMYCHADVYRNVKRENSIVTRQDDAHLRKMVDDFAYAVEYFTRFVEEEESHPSAISDQYIKHLKERRNQYAFFMMIRMVRSTMSRKERNEVLQRLREKGCYPNGGLPKSYGKKYVPLSKLFQVPILFDLVCVVYRLFFK